MALNDKHFYKDFLEAEEGMATNVLSDRLKMLEAFGVIKSEQYEKLKTMKYYSLTEKGIELIPILIELWIWGAKFDPNTVVSKSDLSKKLAQKQESIDNYIRIAKDTG